MVFFFYYYLCELRFRSVVRIVRGLIRVLYCTVGQCGQCWRCGRGSGWDRRKPGACIRVHECQRRLIFGEVDKVIWSTDRLGVGVRPTRPGRHKRNQVGSQRQRRGTKHFAELQAETC